VGKYNRFRVYYKKSLRSTTLRATPPLTLRLALRVSDLRLPNKKNPDTAFRGKHAGVHVIKRSWEPDQPQYTHSQGSGKYHIGRRVQYFLSAQT
jgi:hypothetical protein